MKIYTKTGDKGTTSLLTGERVKKSSLQVEAYGIVDETNSALGIARASATKPDVAPTILKIQKMLALLMAELASNPNDKNNRYITKEHVTELEALIDQFDQKLKPLKCFILPGDSMSGAFLDLARTTARRAERQVLRLFETPSEGSIIEDNNILTVLNRLSDLCFILSRVECEED